MSRKIPTPVLFGFLLLLLSIQGQAQLINAVEAGRNPLQQLTIPNLNGNAFSGDVELSTASYKSSYNFGSVSLPSGLKFDVNLAYQSSFAGGDNPPFFEGVPYGIGWDLQIPSITFKTVDYKKYSLADKQSADNAFNTGSNLNYHIAFSSFEAMIEGEPFWYEPYLNIPGVVSGKLVFKGEIAENPSDYCASCANNAGSYTGTDCYKAVFVLNKFDKYVEVVMQEYYDKNKNLVMTWTAKMPDGTEYVFLEQDDPSPIHSGTTKTCVGAMMDSYREASNQRMKQSTDNDPSNNPYDFTTAPFVYNLVSPKHQIDKFYVAFIQNSNFPGQLIKFHYDKYGDFNFHKDYDGNTETHATYRDVILKEVDAVINNKESDVVIDRIVLNHNEITGAIPSPSKILTTGSPGVDIFDNLYNSEVTYFAGAQTTSELYATDIPGSATHAFTDGWYRYYDVFSDQGGQVNSGHSINSFNPYIYSDGAHNYYMQELVTTTNAPTGSVTFNNAFLESPKINPSQAVSGDLYKVEYAVFSSYSSFDCNFDVNIVAGPSGTEFDNTSGIASPIIQGQIDPNRYYSVFSTFNRAAKFNSDFSSKKTGSNMFVMPNLPNSFNGFRIQVGPANSDHVYNWDAYQHTSSEPGYITYSNIVPNSPPQQSVLPATMAMPHNFGDGSYWWMVKQSQTADIYNHWWSTSAEGKPNLPTCTNYNSNSVNLDAVKLTRFSKRPYMLVSVQHYKLSDYQVGTVQSLNSSLPNTDPTNAFPAAPSCSKLIAEFDLTYDIQSLGAVINNQQYLSSSSVTPSSNNVRYAARLLSVSNRPVDPSNGSVPAPAPSTYPTTYFNYNLINISSTPLLKLDGTFSFYLNFASSNFYILNDVIEPSGKETQITYYPITQTPETQTNIYYDDEPESLGLIETYGFTGSNAIGTNRAYQIYPAVETVTVIAMDNSNSDVNKAITKTYDYSNPYLVGNMSQDIFKSNNIFFGNAPGAPDNPDFGNFYYDGIIDGDICFGTVTVTEPAVASGYSSVTTYTFDNSNYLTFGKLLTETQQTNGNTDHKITFSYTPKEAYENRASRVYYSASQSTPYVDFTSPPSSLTDPTNANNLVNIQDINNDFNASNGSGEFYDISYFYDWMYLYYLLPTNPSTGQKTPPDPQYFNSYFIELISKTEDKYEGSNFLETVTNYEYYDADNTGNTNCYGYNILKKNAGPQQLTYEPSWNLYRQTVTSSQKPTASTSEENFYYYDLINYYNGIPTGFDALSKTQSLHLRDIPYENRSTYFDVNQTNRKVKSTYYVYDSKIELPQFDVVSVAYTTTYGNWAASVQSSHVTNYTQFINQAAPYMADVVTAISSVNASSPIPPGNTSNQVFTAQQPVIKADNTVLNLVYKAMSDVGLTTLPTILTTTTVPAGYVLLTDNNLTNRILNYCQQSNPNGDGSTPSNVMLNNGPAILIDPNLLDLIYSYLSISGNSTIPTGESGIIQSNSPVYYLNTSAFYIQPLSDGQNMFSTIAASSSAQTLPTDQLTYQLNSTILFATNGQLNTAFQNSQVPMGQYYDPSAPASSHAGCSTSGPFVMPQLTSGTMSYGLFLSSVYDQIDYPVLTTYPSLPSDQQIMRFQASSYLRYFFATPTPDYIPLFPFKTLRSKWITARNGFGQVYNEQNATGLQTYNQFNYFNTFQGFVYNSMAMYPFQLTRQVFYNYRFVGLPMFTETGYGLADAQKKSYAYYVNDNSLQTLTDENGIQYGYTYDTYGRKSTETKNTTLLKSYTYGWNQFVPVTEVNNLTTFNTNTYVNAASSNFVETTTYNDAPVAGLQTAVRTRQFIEPLGNQYSTLSQTGTWNGTSFTPDAGILCSGKTNYDVWGRKIQQYKPFINTTAPNNTSPLFNSGTASQTFAYENNYNSKMIASAAEGQTIGGSGHWKTFAYSIIANGGTTAKAQVISALGLTNSAQIGALIPDVGSNTGYAFYKKINTDENGNTSTEYDDAFGRKIADVSVIGTGQAVTQYLYDSKGEITTVINPDGIDPTSASYVNPSTYSYTTLGEVYQKTTPDDGTTKYMYDQLGHVVLEQDANSAAGSYYRYYTFDAYGRILSQKTVTANTSPGSSMCSSCGSCTCNPSSWLPLSNGGVTISGALVDPFSDKDVYTWTYSKSYTTYTTTWVNINFGTFHFSFGIPVVVPHTFALADFLNLSTATMEKEYAYWYKQNITSSPDYSLFHINLTSLGYLSSFITNAAGKPTFMAAYDNTGHPVHFTFYTYNSNGYLASEIQQYNFSNPYITGGTQGSILKIDYPDYDYSGNPKTKNVYLNWSSGSAINFQYYTTYDAYCRIKNEYYATSDQKASGNLIASNTYDNTINAISLLKYYAHGTGSCSSAIDNINYYYDARNRLTGIGGTLYSEQLYYDGNDPYNSNEPSLSDSHNYNGLINGSRSTYTLSSTTYNPSPAFQYGTIYGYQYDGMGRLTNADAEVITGMSGANYVASNPSLGDGSYTFDNSGNLTAISENGGTGNTNSLTYTYTSGTNKLANYYNSSTATTRHFTYDANGNLTTDDGKALTATAYGRANLPENLSVTVGGSGTTFKYMYNANDYRIYKEYYLTPSTVSKEFYLHDATGAEIGVCDLTQPTVSTQWLWNLFDNKMIGRVDWKSVSENLVFFDLDHLSNTRVSYTSPCSGTPTLDMVMDYLPYGKKLRSYISGSALNPTNGEKYLTTQNQRDVETGFDYRGARFYDCDAAKFLSLDPEAKLYPNLSPYNYVGGNPISFVDPTGRVIDNWVFNENGTFVRRDAAPGDDRLEIENSKTKEATFFPLNDPVEDRKNLEYATSNYPSTKLVYQKNDDDIFEYMWNNDIYYRLPAAREAFAGTQSCGDHSKMDFWANSLVNEETNSGIDARDIKKDISFFIFDGTAYNSHDAGNFLWGHAMAELGFWETESRLGAHVNNAVGYVSRDPSRRGDGLLDSPRDQAAIHNGYNFHYPSSSWWNEAASVGWWLDAFTYH